MSLKDKAYPDQCTSNLVIRWSDVEEAVSYLVILWSDRKKSFAAGSDPHRSFSIAIKELNDILVRMEE